MNNEMSPKILVNVSGNLAAESMTFVLRRLESARPNYELVTTTDGFLPTIDKAIAKDWVRLKPPYQSFLQHIKSSDLFVTSIRSPGKFERQLLRIAKAEGIPSLVLLADSGSGGRKFADETGLIVPDVIAVADPVTHELLHDCLPRADVRALGSPYLDQFFLVPKVVDQPIPNVAGFLSVPNKQDFLRTEETVLFHENSVFKILLDAVRNSMSIILRLHPKEFERDNYDRPFPANVMIENNIQRRSMATFVSECSCVLSTYSTGLLVAKLLGRPAASIQPTDRPVRQELYRQMGIPILKSSIDVSRFLQCPAPKVRSLEFYNEGCSMESMLALIDEMLNG